MHIRLSRIADLVRRHSLEIVRSCVKNCECLCGYKLHRAQQVYNRLWGIPRSKILLRALRTRTIMFGVTSLALFDWEAERIPDSTLIEHYKDLDHVKQLTRDTLICRHCGQRLLVDIPAAGVHYCSCGNAALASNPSPGDWAPFIERKDLLVWRRELRPKSGLFEYKLYGAYPEVAAEVFLQVQVDTEYRLEWDKSAVSVRVVDCDPKTKSQVLYWEMKWPKFFSNRDYVFNRRYIINKENKVIVIRNQVTNHPDLPETNDKYRVKEYCCTMVIKPFNRLDQPGVEFCMTYYDNPGLSLPNAIQTWVATSAMPDFLVRLRNASVVYARRRGFYEPNCKGTSSDMFSVINEAVLVS